MADVKTIDIDGIQWSIKDQEARNNIVDLDNRVSVMEGKKYYNLSWEITEDDDLSFSIGEGNKSKTIFKIPSFNLDEGGRFLLIINYIHFKVLSSAYQLILRLNINGKVTKEFFNNSQVFNDAIINGCIPLELGKGVNNISVEAVTSGGKEVLIYRSISEPFLCYLTQLT